MHRLGNKVGFSPPLQIVKGAMEPTGRAAGKFVVYFWIKRERKASKCEGGHHGWRNVRRENKISSSSPFCLFLWLLFLLPPLVNWEEHYVMAHKPNFTLHDFVVPLFATDFHFLFFLLNFWLEFC
jgi:hypothetical protein